MGIKNVRKISLVILLFSVVFLVSGCYSNESKAEKLAKSAEQFAENLNYEQAIPTYMEAHNLHSLESV